jgi:AcrR family transcriptional regulator
VTGGTRSRLIAAASELLDRGGPAEVTLREVGKLAGVSHNAPYKHFADKEALLAVIATEEMRAQAGLMRRLIDEQPPLEALRLLARAYIDRARARPARFKLSFSPWARGSDDLREAANETRALLVSIVEAAQSRAELPAGDPGRLGALMLALLYGAVAQSLTGHLSAEGKGGADPEDLVDDLLRYLKAAV